MSRAERDKDRAQEIVTRKYGRGAAISEDPTPEGVRFTVWTPDGREAHVHDHRGQPLFTARRAFIATLIAMGVVACSSPPGATPESAPSSESPTPPEHPTRAWDASTALDAADGGVDSGAAPCGVTRASQEMCFPRWLVETGAIVTSVDFTTCDDDGNAFITKAHAEGFDCYRPSAMIPGAPVWCCTYTYP